MNEKERRISERLFSTPQGCAIERPRESHDARSRDEDDDDDGGSGGDDDGGSGGDDAPSDPVTRRRRGALSPRSPSSLRQGPAFPRRRASIEGEDDEK